jgi:hypothetical protein
MPSIFGEVCCIPVMHLSFSFGQLSGSRIPQKRTLFSVGFSDEKHHMIHLIWWILFLDWPMWPMFDIVFLVDFEHCL